MVIKKRGFIMKKIAFIAPLLCMGFLASCGNKINYEVTEEEFNKAFLMEGEDYLQETVYGDGLGFTNEEEKPIMIQQMSPSAFRYVGDTDTYYHEIFVLKTSEGYFISERESKEAPMPDPVEGGEDEFITVQMEGEYIRNLALGDDLEYKNFSFSNEEKAYVYEFEELNAKICLSFENKRLTNFKYYFDGELLSRTVFTYEQITPEIK